MVGAVIDLGSTKFSSKDSRLALTLTSTCLIDIPAHIGPATTAQGLHQLTKSGQLWIARAGMCRLSVFTSTTGTRDSQIPASVGTDGLAETISSCQIWSQLGLRLSRDTRTGSSGTSAATDPQLCFSIDHPPSASGLVAPNQIPCAYFQGVECRFRFELSETRKQTLETPTRSTSVIPARRSKGIKHRVGKRQPQGVVDTSSKTPLSAAEIFGDPAMHMEATNLTLAALRNLIGVGKRVHGIRASPSSRSPTLLEMVPAALNFHYLNTIASRSSFLPSITSVLGNLSHSQSPNLRQKAAELSRAQSEMEYGAEPLEVTLPGFEEPSYDRDSAYKNIERRLWQSLLVSTSVLVGTDRRARNRSTPGGPVAEEKISLPDSNTHDMALSVDMTRRYFPGTFELSGLLVRRDIREDYQNEKDTTQDPHQCYDDKEWSGDEQGLAAWGQPEPSPSLDFNWDRDDFPIDVAPHTDDLSASRLLLPGSTYPHDHRQQEVWLENDLGDHPELNITDIPPSEYLDEQQQETVLYLEDDDGYYIAYREQLRLGDEDMVYGNPMTVTRGALESDEMNAASADTT